MTIRLRRASAAVAAVALALAGCVTVPPPGYPPQRLAVSTLDAPKPTLGWGTAPQHPPEEIAGVHCTATNNRGSWSLVTPGVFAIERSRAPLRITCRKEGYRDARVDLTCVMPGADAAGVGQLVPFLGPFMLVVIPAAVIASIASTARDEVCAYGAGRAVQVQMER